MKRIMLFAAVCVLVLAGTSHSDDATRKAKAEELMVLMKVKQTMEKSFEAMKQMMPMQLQQMGVAPGDAAEKEKVMKLTMDIITEEMSWDKIKDEMIAVYAEILTEQELQGLIDFYGSPVGKAFIEKQPELMTRSMRISQSRMMVVMPMIKKKIDEKKAQSSGQ